MAHSITRKPRINAGKMNKQKRCGIKVVKLAKSPKMAANKQIHRHDYYNDDNYHSFVTAQRPDSCDLGQSGQFTQRPPSKIRSDRIHTT